jgi:hypothetical protein
MPSYADLRTEQVWLDQFVPPVMNAVLLVPLRAHFGLGPVSIGAPGDNNHMYGRHRSYNWSVSSRYCTNRSYGTTDSRDQGGDRDWYRGFDVGITGQDLYDASRRMDALARSGECPGLAEWFGTFDGQRVVGWFEGGPSSSDSSHLSHLHGGVWNSYADDEATMAQIFGAITGLTPEKEEDPVMAFLARDTQSRVVVVTDDWNGWYRPPQANAAETQQAIDDRAHWRKAMGLPDERWISEDNKTQARFNFGSARINGLFGPDLGAVATGGAAVDYDRIEDIVDTELDEQSRAGADTD